MNLLTTDELGWATFALLGRLTTVSLLPRRNTHESIDLGASTLRYFCNMIANLDNKTQEKSAPLQITAVDTINSTFTLTWQKTQSWTFNTIAFLTQAAPELVSTYRQSVTNLAGKWR